jgi:hypothetical protein
MLSTESALDETTERPSQPHRRLQHDENKALGHTVGDRPVIGRVVGKHDIAACIVTGHRISSQTKKSNPTPSSAFRWGYACVMKISTPPNDIKNVTTQIAGIILRTTPRYLLDADGLSGRMEAIAESR